MSRHRREPDRSGRVPVAPRRDIQALRAIAVGIVVVYHVWPNRLTGGYVGVDVFFVISGFLITLHLLQRPIKGPADLLAFWARRVRRLIPAATVVLVATVVATLIWLPATVHARIAQEAIASSLYVENWMLAVTSTDYLATDQLHSATQHYWSLSVEEQFYILWPVLLGLTYVATRRVRARRANRPAGATTGLVLPTLVLGAITAASLAWSVYYTEADAASAYFVTPTRLWELGVGALLAVAVRAGFAARSTAVRSILVWCGLAAILYAAVLFTGETPFPGTAALVPTLGAAAVLAADSDDLSRGPRRLWSVRPVQWLGDVSYSVYLWHWPAIVIAPFVVGADLHLGQKLALIGLVLVLAAGSKRWVEDAMRFTPRLARSTGRSFLLLLGCLAVTGTVAGLALWQTARATAVDEGRVVDTSAACVGVDAQRSSTCAGRDLGLIMSPISAAEDKPDVYADDCWNKRPFTRRKTCTYGKASASVRVALYGNSHAGQWHPPINQTVDKQGWRLDTYLASECYSVDVPVEFSTAELEKNCTAWNTWARGRITAGNYDLVVMSDRTFQPLAGVAKGEKQSVAQASYRRVLKEIVASGAKVVVVRDTPAATGSVPDCVAEHPDDLSRCVTPLAKGLEPDPLTAAAKTLPGAGVSVLDMTGLLCRTRSCPAVVGGLITYFDHGHMTKTFSSTLYPEVSAALRKALTP
ncbi:MAG: acyltransferase [Humibacillus sp.]|nr:acyltransferase [Humibacillus sp.]MDN5778090.1 acyltransferase [Humibacillus sp.]